jgi:hypothetical protein
MFNPFPQGITVPIEIIEYIDIFWKVLLKILND